MYCHNMQNNVIDCGIAVLKTVFQQLKINIPTKFLNGINLDDLSQGLSLKDLTTILGNYGVVSDAYEVYAMNEIKSIKFPAIAIVNNAGLNHYVVVHNYNPKSGFVISDPEKSDIYTVETSVFEEKFAGYIICIEKIYKTRKTKLSSIGKTLYKEIISSLTYNEKFGMVSACFVKWVVPLMLIFSAEFLLIYYVEKLNLSTLITLITFYVASLCCYIYMNIFDIHKKTKMENRISRKIAMNYLMKQVITINPEKNVNNIEGVFWNIMISVTGVIQKFYLGIDFIFIAVCGLLMLKLNYIYFLVMMLGFIVLLIYCKKVSNIIKNRQVEMIGTSGEVSNTVQEMAQSSFDLNLYSDMRSVEKYCQDTLEKYETVKGKMRNDDIKIHSLYDMMTYSILIIGFAIIIISYLYRLAFSSTDLFMGFYISVFFAMLFKPTLMKWIEYQKSINAIEYIEAITDFSGLLTLDKDKLQFDRINNIKLHNICVSYGEKKVLDDLSFKVEKGDIIGIKGTNGVGKTTLMKIILGVIKPNSGNIIINDELSIDDLSNTDITKYISAYSPDLFLYSTSIKNNIIFNIVEKINVNVCASNLMSKLPLEYLVLSNGINISQGEKQKILLDRCLHQDKDIYIFDEPGSNLDELSKQDLCLKLKLLSQKGKGVVLISHDNDMLRMCDKIYVLDNGKIHLQ